MKLETLTNITDVEREEIQALAVQIFTVNSPQDPAPLMETYELSLNVGRSFQACTITGRAIQDSPSYTCRACRHQFLEYEIENYAKNHPQENKLQHCPLCHSPLLYTPIAERVGGGGGGDHGHHRRK